MNHIIEIIEDGDWPHLTDIVRIQEELAIGKEMIESGERIAERGLLISGYTRDELAEHINAGGVLFAAFDPRQESYVGYLLATNPNYFSPKYNGAKVWWNSKDIRAVYEPIIKNNDYVYLDQLGLFFDHHGTGVASRMMDEFEKVNRGKTVITLIMSEPIDNIRSRAFILKHGYETVCEILFPKYGTIENFRGHLFVKEL